MTSTASRISVASTKMPKRNFMACSFMALVLRRLCHFLQALAGLALDELLHARVGTLAQLLGSAVEEDLRLACLEPPERIEHHDAVGDLVDRLHFVRDDDAGD